ncbi:MAG TPA: hypothetical protein VFR31_16435, partial [Thermoanaerobaculia bacterium]|nr:hypothetical protein [Thermoanaerobaculia bacterium]
MGERALFGLIFIFVIGVFSLMALFSQGCQSWFMYVFLMPFYATFPSMIFPGLGIGALIAWAVLFPILKMIFGKRIGKGIPTWGRRGGGPPFIFFGGGGGGWGSGGGWGGGGGGFSGGGGSFGGGGSSGSW